MGGTFDPIHVGHLIAANESLRTLKLDQVMFIPAGQPWQTSHRYVTPARDRMFMVERAIFGNPKFVASDIEIRYDGPTYAAETMQRLRAWPMKRFTLSSSAFAMAAPRDTTPVPAVTPARTSA